VGKQNGSIAKKIMLNSLAAVSLKNKRSAAAITKELCNAGLDRNQLESWSFVDIWCYFLFVIWTG